MQANQLVIRLQPQEGMRLKLMTKDPGPGGLRLRPRRARHQFRGSVFGALSRRLRAPADGHPCAATPRCFMRRDEVEAAWWWVEPILNAWEQSAEKPKPYAAGSWGPTASIALIERDGRTWHEDL